MSSKKPRTYRRNLPRPPGSPPSRQQLWQLKKIRENRCITCGKDKEESPFRFHCVKCGLKARENQRKRTGYKERRPGGPGRPPFKIEVESPTEYEKFYECKPITQGEE